MASQTGPGIPTPPSSAAPSQHPSPLPQPRRHPLKPGGQKESEVISYLDNGINQIQKRVDNRNTKKKGDAPLRDQGYNSFTEVTRDIDGLVDVIWVSGSPNLQMPYLLTLAGLTTEYLSLFPPTEPSTRATFSLLSKLDYAFSSLLIGQDAASGATLPGFEGGRTISTTDKVRLKGIVDRSRLVAVRVIRDGSVVEDEDDVEDTRDTDTDPTPIPSDRPSQDTVSFEGFENSDEDDDEDEHWIERGISVIYEKTIGELGDVLGGPPIGIITDDWKDDRLGEQKRDQGFVERDEIEM